MNTTSAATFVKRIDIEPGRTWALMREPNGEYSGLDEIDLEDGSGNCPQLLQPHQVADLLERCGIEGKPRGGRLWNE